MPFPVRPVPPVPFALACGTLNALDLEPLHGALTSLLPAALAGLSLPTHMPTCHGLPASLAALPEAGVGPPPPSTSSPGCLAGPFQLLGSEVPERRGEEHRLLQYVSRPGLFCVQTGVGIPALRRCWVDSWAWSTGPTSPHQEPSQLEPLQAKILPGMGAMEGRAHMV